MRRDAVLLVVGVVMGAVLGCVTAPNSPGNAAAETLAAAPDAVADRPSPPAAPAVAQEPVCTPAPLEKRAAQVLFLGLSGVRSADDPLAQELVDLGVGGVLLTQSNVVDGRQVRALVDGLRSRADVPPLVAADEERGRVSTFRRLLEGGVSARRLAAGAAPQEVRDGARALGARLAELGVDLNLAPVADLDDGPAGGIIGDRSFSADPDVATAYTLAFARGLQDAGIIPVVKHFPGHGESRGDSHYQLARVAAPLEELRDDDLVPFQHAIDAGLPVVMLNHLAYEALDPDLPASLSPAAYGLLRDMGFTGVAMTDALGMGAVNTTWPLPEAAVRALDAGADVLLANQGVHGRAMRDAVVDAVRSGRVREGRLDDAVGRVLALKGVDPATMVCR